MLRATTYVLSVRTLLTVKSSPLCHYRIKRAYYCNTLLMTFGRYSVRTQLLLRRPPTDFQVATISQHQPNFKKIDPKIRKPCPLPPPPPPKPPKNDALLWGTLSLIIMAGGLLAYCQRNPEMRDWLSINAAWIDDMIAILFQENMTHQEFALTCIDNFKQYFNSFMTPDKQQKKPKQCSSDGAPVPPVTNVPEEADIESTEAGEVCKPISPPVVTKDICEIEFCLKDFGETILNNLETAREACRYYNNLVEETMKKFSYQRMKYLKHAMEERIELVETSTKNVCQAFNQLEELTRYLVCGVKATKEQLENARSTYNEYVTKAKILRMQFTWENDKALVVDRQWQMVDDVISKYAFENEHMFPGLKYEAKHLNFSGDPDILLYSTYRYMTQLEDELKVANQGMVERTNRALEVALPQPKDENEMKQREARIQARLKQREADVDADLRKRESDQKSENEKQLKHLLDKQLERHERLLAQRLDAKEKEFASKFDGMVKEKVAIEKQDFNKQLAAMALKLKVLEDNLNARLKAERETRRSQELWTAGASLLAATKKGEKLVKVDKELSAIEKASDGDKLVKTVLQSIPQSVREKGLIPESVLRESYHQMEKIALNVALVEAEGAPLPVYMLSWIQGLLLFMKTRAQQRDANGRMGEESLVTRLLGTPRALQHLVLQLSGIPQAEYDKPPKEPSDQLDTFDLLQRARFWIDQGNLQAALKYVNSLSGASRAAANKWYEQAREHLEVRQAADAILAHAAALGLQYI